MRGIAGNGGGRAGARSTGRTVCVRVTGRILAVLARRVAREVGAAPGRGSAVGVADAAESVELARRGVALQIPAAEFARQRAGPRGRSAATAHAVVTVDTHFRGGVERS